MKCFLSCGVALLTALTASFALATDKDKAANNKAAEAEIRQSARQFAEAFEHADARAIGAMWSEDGTLVDEQGQLYKGRKAIEAEYAAFFKREPGAKIDIAVQSVELPATNVAVEDGIARVTAKSGEPPVGSRYTAVHTLVDGKWRLASVRETAVEMPSHGEQLSALDFLVGRWEAKADKRTMETNVRWLANKNFLEREYVVRNGGVVISSGKQIIAFDPQAGKIQSWSFDSSGGHGEGLWSEGPDGFDIESRGMLVDGTPTASHDMVIRVPGEDDVVGFKSVDRRAGGADLPDLPEIVLDRVKDKSAHLKSPSEK